MKWRWSLSKQAAENDMPQPVVPLDQPKQQIPVQPAPVVQQPQQIQKQPVTPAQPAPTNKIDLFKYNNPDVVQNMNGFIMAHLPNAPKTPENAHFRKEPKKWIETFKASAVSWKVFQELYYTITKGAGETDGQFLQRVTYEKPFDGVDAEELGLPQFVDPTEKEDDNDKFGDFKNKIADTEKADKLVRPFLEEIAESYLQNNRDLLAALSQYNNPNKANQVAPSAQTMGFAPFEFFLGNGKGVSMKKWKIFFTENPDLLPGNVTARMDSGLSSSVKEAIDHDIISTSAESPGEMPSIINKLQEIANSTSFIDPSALSSLDSLPQENKATVIHQLMDRIEEGGDEQSLLLKYILGAARTLASMKDKQNQSTDMALGEGGASVSSITKDEKALDPAKMLPKMADNELLIVDQIWKHFIQNHKDTIIQLRDAVDQGSGIVMLKALAEVQENPKGILDEAVHSSFSGFHEMKKDGEVMESWNNWIDLFLETPQMLPQGMQGNPQQIQENSKELLPGILKALDEPQTAEAVKAHVYKKGYAYIQRIFQDRGLDRQQGLKDLIPNVGNIKTLNRIGKMAYGYMYREFMARIASGAEQLSTAARTYSLLKARVESMSKSLYRLLNTNDMIWLSDDKAVYRNEQGTIIIGDGLKYDRKAKKQYWKSELPLTDENFNELQSLMDIEDWVPQAIDTMRVQYDKHDTKMRSVREKSGKPPYESFLAKSENKVKEINGKNIVVKTKKDNVDVTSITLFSDRERTQQLLQDSGNLQRQQKKSIIYTINDNIYQSMPNVVYVRAELADGTTSDFVHNKLGAVYAQANAEHSNKVNGDYLQGYRSSMGQNLSSIREKMGLSIEDIAARLKSKKKKDEVSRKGGTRLRGKHITTEQFIDAFEKGEPVLFGEGDLEELASAMGIDHKEFFAPATLYDQQNKDDLTDLAETLPYSYGTYGGYLLQKQRECVRRKTMHEMGNPKTLWYFLTIMRVHPVFSSDSPSTVSDRRKGKMLADLTEGRPLGLPGTLQERKEKARQNLEFVNPKKALDPDASPADKAPLEKPDLYNNYLNNAPNFRKHYLPNAEHPLGMEQREFAPDLDKFVKNNDEKSLLTDPETGEPKTLDQWKEYTLKTLRGRADSNEPEILQKRLQDEINAGKSPVEIANELIEKTWNGNDKVKPNLEMLTQRVNDFNKKHGGKQFTPEEYAQKYCDDHVKSAKYFRDEAKKKLSDLEGAQLSPSEMLEAYVPARVRRNWPYSQMPFKRQEHTPDEMKDISESDKPEQIARLQEEKGSLNAALAIVKERTGVEGEQALNRLTGNMRKLNKYRSQNDLATFNSVDEYAKHFVNEAIELEKYKRNKIKENVDALNAPVPPGGKKLDPGTKSKLRERLSRDERRILTAVAQLAHLGNMQRKSMALGLSSIHIATLADQIADNVIRNLYVSTTSAY